MPPCYLKPIAVAQPLAAGSQDDCHGLTAKTALVRIELDADLGPRFDGIQAGRKLLALIWQDPGLGQPEDPLDPDRIGGLDRTGQQPFSVYFAPITAHALRVLDSGPRSIIAEGLELAAETAVLGLQDLPLARDPMVQALCQAGKYAWQRGLVSGQNGNLSHRQTTGMLITRSQAAKGRLGSQDVLRIGQNGRVVQGQGRPSSEWQMHQAVYANQPEAKAIIHGHPLSLLALSLSQPVEQGLGELSLYETRALLSKLITVPFLEPGSAALASVVGEAAKVYRAVFMNGHGLVCWGEDIWQALDLAEGLEALARIRLDQGKRIP